VAWAVIRGFALDGDHPLVAAISFTPYMAMTSPIPVMAALMLRRWVIAVVALVAAIALAGAVLPRAADSDNKASADDRGTTLVVMTSNLRYGNGDPRRVMQLARDHDVDVLSLQEVNSDTVPRLDREAAKRVFPYRLVQDSPGAGGSALLSRRSLRAAGPEDLTGARQPEGAISVPGAGRVHVKVTHPPTPISEPLVEDWRRLMRQYPGPREGTALRILAGDFNATLDHREFRQLLDRGWYDAADATGDALKTTWPTTRRRPELTLDHILVPPPIKVREVSVHTVLGSDHRAVIAELVVPPNR
jgi:endonuclease/exonuclease/phosphatase family metal-dependent hydrolase